MIDDCHCHVLLAVVALMQQITRLDLRACMSFNLGLTMIPGPPDCYESHHESMLTLLLAYTCTLSYMP